ncbi:DUF6745 domain-containing protein [Nostoc parmelioides]|uniref:DUF6745 domain-containing protein n=1 Tax=Nostoc parmelioides FACHB-3921 TaxID=2692909 RepID=A0ABR8B8F4_9NOSO|nr:hypothetical protein [Nostoc parmelioides]MBD2250392.1 hypothetical protein [Nostoc parmelioides FACHB-3921]
MLNMMSGGRIPKKRSPQHPQENHQPVSPQLGRKLILEHRAWEGIRVLGHLDLSGATELGNLPENLTCESLDISGCVNLVNLPPGLHVTRWIELAGSGIKSLGLGHGFVLRWRGVEVSDYIAFESQSITGQDILKIENVELRRVLIERLGYETFLQQVGGLVRDRDKDAGGERQLVYIPFEDDEALMVLKVTCPSTGHIHILRVPPQMQSCHQAAAWVAGFDNPDDYHPLIEA